MQFKESSTLELKQIIVQDIKKEVIAFANTKGGIIYVGIADDGSIIGLEDPDQAILQASSMIHDAIKPDLTMFVDLDLEYIDKKTILKITVQKGTHAPYYLQSKGIRPEGVYIRKGAAAIPASEDAIRAMIKENDGDRFESRRSLRQDLTFTALKNFFDKKNLKLEEQQFMTLGLMTHEGIYTNLALLLSDECQHSLKAAVFSGTKKTDPFQNRREFHGSLIHQLQDTYEVLQQYNQLGSNFNGLIRNDQRDYPEIALRESLLNTIVHREYSYSGSTLINIFQDRIEFISFGGLVQGLNLDDLRLGISECRNEKLAALFYRLKLIEAYGTGIPKIYESYENSTLQPKLEVSDHAFRITLPNRNFIQRDTAPVVSHHNDLFTAMHNNLSFTRPDVEKKLGVSRSQANKLIKQLVTSGQLKAHGNGRNRYYTITTT